MGGGALPEETGRRQPRLMWKVSPCVLEGTQLRPGQWGGSCRSQPGALCLFSSKFPCPMEGHTCSTVPDPAGFQVPVVLCVCQDATLALGFRPQMAWAQSSSFSGLSFQFPNRAGGCFGPFRLSRTAPWQLQETGEEAAAGLAGTEVSCRAGCKQ